jgi:FHS family glucose/mannose:H+ symporter-like MFS transporter
MITQTESAVEEFQRRRTVSSLVLCVGFGLTGAGTVMLGVLLPELSLKWGLRDDTAGFLFFLQFLGSSGGALLTGANHTRSLVIGYGLLVVMAGALAVAGPQTAFPIFLLFGLGLGMTMTATSLLFSDRYGKDRAAVLERINFGWSVGATAAPMLFVPFLRMASLRPLFFTLQGLFLLLLIWVIVRERQDGSRAPSQVVGSQTHRPAHTGSLLPLVVLAMCAVGVESSLSGWLTTYSHRADLAGIGGEAIATSLFWFGIMMSRLAFSTRLLAMMGRRRVLNLTLCGAAIAVALLVGAQDASLIRVAAAMAGLCVGPLYPLVLSFLLERSSRGWIFAVAGLGSAVFPWLTGSLSARYGSLRYGLIAPCCAALLMIVLLMVSLRPAKDALPA